MNGKRQWAFLAAVLFLAALSPHADAELRAIHRAGQTFLIFPEIDRLVDREPITWGELKAVFARLDQTRQVRYRVYRHTAPITAATLAEAERIAEVAPRSGYNARGRSVDECIAVVRRKALDDAELAKDLARSDYFDSYTPDSPPMDDVLIERFSVEPGKPLPQGLGLYVHNPDEEGNAYYAVTCVVNGSEDSTTLVAMARPVTESVGLGEPVLQGEANVTVFYDYPGRRYRYVQWAAPPLTHQPGEYYNWGVFVPAGYAAAKIKRLSVFFHDSRQRYLKPPWPHRQDTVLISPHDAPLAGYGYGYNDALGSGKPLKEGTVRPFFARRVDAGIDWAIDEFGADPARVSVGGRGYWGGTAALQYGLKRPGKVAYVLAGSNPDPDPGQTPESFLMYSWRDNERPRPTPIGQIEAVWGNREWELKTEDGQSIWKVANLVDFVNSADHPLPYLSLGAGSMSFTWKQQTELMQAFRASRNAFMAQFYWGGSDFVDVPRGAFEPRSDRPFLATWPLIYNPNATFMDKHFFTGRRGYGGGSRLNNRVRWESETIVDTADRLEFTVFSDRAVSYAGTSVCETTVRNATEFRPNAGEKLAWTLAEVAGRNQQLGAGEITVDKDGRIVLDELAFGPPARLVIVRVK
jgi:hypothetical protein